MRLGVDTGGTFTDLVAEDGRIVKVPTTAADPSQGVAEGIALMGDETPGVLAHGTTVATNALLERRGANVALVTTAGFKDVIEIGRQDRPSLYDAFVDRPEPLVTRRHRLEVTERVAPDGTVVAAPGPVPEIPDDVAAVAVSLLHSDLHPAHEQAVATELRARGLDVTASHEVAPEFREYERTVTTVLNAYLRPACRSYLAALDGLAGDVVVLTSAGGLVPIRAAAGTPAALLLSGPAGGVLAGAAAAVAAGFPDAVTFDMGGTSTDVCLVLDGRPAPATQRTVAGLPVRLPSLDVRTIGAGGGSIAGLDPGGALTVGPISAGAVPGPACYGRGGTAPTVTDADLVAGHLAPGTALPGIGPLSVEAARTALGSAGEEVTAEGVVAVVDAAMVEAVRAVSVARGVDPAGLALVAFGGAGPLHACAVADALGMAAVVVPPRAGVLSAVGLLASPLQVDLVRSWPTPIDHAGLAEASAALRAEAAARLADGVNVAVQSAVDCRYEGQGHELTVAEVSAFEDEHERVNGYRRTGTPVEVIALRAVATLASPVAVGDLTPPPPGRHAVTGPAAVSEPDCGLWVPDGWHAEVHPSGAWVIRRVTTARGVLPPTSTPRALDPAGLQVLIAGLTGIAEEMGLVLRRAAFSPNIRERADCSAALFTPAGDLLAQAEHVPVHLGSMPASVRAAIAAVANWDRPVEAGDQIVLNDPFAGGTHLNDVTLVAPCLVEGELVGWVANRAHHADVGGMVPGSIPPDATEAVQEGLSLPPVRLTADVAAILRANSRTPVERAGDLDAQAGANRVGVARLAALAGAPIDQVVAYGERRMRQALASVPDGSWSFADVLDAGTRIAVRVDKTGEAITFDFTGTDPQGSGNINAVEAVTVSAVAWAIRACSDPSIPANGGTFRPVRVIAPSGSVVAARWPAAVGAGNVEVSQRVADVCLGALAQAVPDRVPAASQGTMNNVMIGGQGWVYYETLGGGQGGRPPGPGRPARDGMSGIHTAMTNTQNTPIEALERAYPMRVLRYELRRDSGGAGVAAGGEGIARDLEMLEEVTVSLVTERRAARAWGLAGGSSGASGENWLVRGAGAERLPGTCTRQFNAGDVLRVLTPGGGGWGPPTPEHAR